MQQSVDIVRLSHPQHHPQNIPEGLADFLTRNDVDLETPSGDDFPGLAGANTRDSSNSHQRPAPLGLKTGFILRYDLRYDFRYHTGVNAQYFY